MEWTEADQIKEKTRGKGKQRRFERENADWSQMEAYKENRVNKGQNEIISSLNPCCVSTKNNPELKFSRVQNYMHS